MSEKLGAIALSARPRRTRVVDRWYSVSVALMLILLNIVAFAPSLIDPSRRTAPLPLTPLVLIHAVASVGWLLLFLAQTTLAATSRVPTHRRVGIVGAALSVAVVVLGVLVVMAQARRGFDLSGDIARLPLPTGVDGLSATVALLFFPVQFGILVVVMERVVTLGVQRTEAWRSFARRLVQ
jgi:hypothetical protein